MKMSRLKVCRICLAINVRMQELTDVLLNKFDSVLGSDKQHLHLDQYACYTCVVLINKYCEFRTRCLTSQSILDDIIDTCGQVTEDTINLVDREGLQLNTSLSHHMLPNVIIPSETSDEVVEVDSDSDWDMIDEVPLIHHFRDDENNQAKETSNTKQADDDAKKRLEKIKKRSEKFSWLKDFRITNLTISEQKEEVLKRRSTSNYQNSPYKCEMCNRGYLHEKTLKSHIQRHDVSAGDIVCEVCHLRFNMKKIYLFHIARHSKRYSCRKCHYITVQPDAARKHKKWHDNDNYECVYCDQLFTNLKVYLRHLKIKHKSKYLCNDCGYSFISRKGLRMHTIVAHKDTQLNIGTYINERKEKKVCCKVCNIHLNNRVAWKRHVLMSARHKFDSLKGCRRCRDKKLPQNVDTHLSSQKPSTSTASTYSQWLINLRVDNYPTTCQYCTEPILNKTRHWKHYQKCNTNKDGTTEILICDHCGDKFKDKRSLSEHKASHPMKRFKCPICPLSFDRRKYYRLHVKSHPEHTLYSCRTCGLVYKTKSGLKRHSAKHTGIAPCPQKQPKKRSRRNSQTEPHILQVHKKVVRETCI